MAEKKKKEPFEFDYTEWKDSGPSPKDLKNLKKMAAASATGTMWSRIATLISALIFGVLLWMELKQMQLARIIARQKYFIKRSKINKKRVKDPMVGRPRKKKKNG